MTCSPPGLPQSPECLPEALSVHPLPAACGFEAVALQPFPLPAADAGAIRLRLLQRRRPERLRQLRWAAARLAFYAYIGFSMLTIAGGFITAPLMTWLFYNDWRFWRHWGRAWRLFPHAWHIAWQMLRGEGQFMFSVPLTSMPQPAPDTRLVELSPAWRHGSGCGDCHRCCEILSLRCPVLDEATGFCSGYNSFYWRYFNCGRFPSRAVEIRYYGCDKWRMR